MGAQVNVYLSQHVFTYFILQTRGWFHVAHLAKLALSYHGNLCSTEIKFNLTLSVPHETSPMPWDQKSTLDLNQKYLVSKIVISHVTQSKLCITC